MALLIVDLDKHIGNAKAWRDTVAEQLPEKEFASGPIGDWRIRIPRLHAARISTCCRHCRI